jgi:hypothetical protein
VKHFYFRSSLFLEHFAPVLAEAPVRTKLYAGGATRRQVSALNFFLTCHRQHQTGHGLLSTGPS